MKFLSGLFGRKSDPQPNPHPGPEAKTTFEVEVEEKDMAILEAAAEVANALDADPAKTADLDETMGAEAEPSDLDEVDLSTVETVMDNVGKPRQASVNIWDLDEDEEAEAETAAPVVAAPDRSSSRARRNRTRLIGFDKSDGDVVDLFDESEQVAPTERVQFPVGWMLVVEGPGRGHCFALTAGMAQIGRGDDQAVQLDFGDSAISRTNHAAIVYDPDGRKFILGHGGKANIVRLNGKPVISNEDLADGDKISIGETVLKLKTLCGPDFDWSDTDSGEEHEDVAIA